MTSQKPVTVRNRQSGLYEDTFWHSLWTTKLNATTDCLGNLTLEMPKASPSDMATGSSLLYFAHMSNLSSPTYYSNSTNKVCLPTQQLLEKQMRHYFSKTSTFHGDFGTYFSSLTPVFSEYNSSLASDLPQ